MKKPIKDKVPNVNYSRISVIAGPLVAQLVAWYLFFDFNPYFPVDTIVLIAELLSVLTPIYLTTRIALLKHGKPWHVVYLLLNRIILIIVYFADLYWLNGYPRNFNITLSRLDAIYFSLGTLTTAGTGSIAAESPFARGIVSIQMFIDFLFVAATIAIAITRLGEKWTK